MCCHELSYDTILVGLLSAMSIVNAFLTLLVKSLLDSPLLNVSCNRTIVITVSCSKMGVVEDGNRRLVEEVYGKQVNYRCFVELRVPEQVLLPADLIKDIRDPEKPHTLEELGVVSEEEISVSTDRDAYSYVSVTLIPTVPHCHLAAIIGLCVRTKLEENLPYNFKLDIFIKEGSHTTAAELSKQINDKERVAAAMENKNIKDMVQNCVSYETM